MLYRHAMLAVLASVTVASAAYADHELSPHALNEIRASLASVGCEPGEIEFDDGFYEVEGARCERGYWNITLDQGFAIIGRDRDE